MPAYPVTGFGCIGLISFDRLSEDDCGKTSEKDLATLAITAMIAK